MALVERRSSRLAAFPATPIIELEAMEELIVQFQEEEMYSTKQLQILRQLSGTLELAEQQFERLVGDVTSGSSMRGHFRVGRLAAVVQASTIMETVAETWVLENVVSHAQRADGLRFLLACMVAGGLTYPPTEESFVASLREWATLLSSSSSSNTGQDSPEEEAAKEAVRTHATGLLAIAFSHSAHCEEAVRAQFMNPLISHIHTAAASLESGIELRLPTARLQAPRPMQGNPHPVQRPLQGGAESPPRNVASIDLPSDSSDDVNIATGLGAASMCPPESPDDFPADAIENAAWAQGSISLKTLRLLERGESSACSPLIHANEVPAPTLAEIALEEGPSTKVDPTISVPSLNAVAARTSTSYHPGNTASSKKEIDEELSPDSIRLRRLQYSVQCAASLGEYLEFLPPLMAVGGVKLILRLLDAWRSHANQLDDALRLLNALLAHRRLADALVDEGGLELLLSLPRSTQTCTNLSLVQVGITLIPSAFQRAIALPKEVLHSFVAAALDHLRSTSDAARKNASIFCGNALVQPAILEVFDEAEGLKKLLAAVKASRLMLKQPQAQELRQEKQICYHLCQAVSAYFRAQFMMVMRESLPATPPAVDSIEAKAIELGLEAFNSNLRLVENISYGDWKPVAVFLASGGPTLMLDILQASPGERYFNEMATAALQVLQISTLVPSFRSALLNCRASEATSHQDAISVLLSAAQGQAFMYDPEVRIPAVQILQNFVQPPHAHASYLRLEPDRRLERKLRALRDGYADARQAVRVANGLKVLLDVLCQNPCKDPQRALATLKLRHYAVQALQGLAEDASICHTLQNLQLGNRLAGLLHEIAGSCRMSQTSEYQSLERVFYLQALELISSVTPGLGTAEAALTYEAAAPALHKLERAAIAASSNITYNPSELLILIKDHLHASGLSATAEMLEREVASNAGPAPTSCTPTFRPPFGRSSAQKRISFGPSLQESVGKFAARGATGEAHTPGPESCPDQNRKPGSQTLPGNFGSRFMATPPSVPKPSVTDSTGSRKRPAVSQLSQQAHPSFRCTAPSRQAVNQMRQMDSRQKEQRLTGDELASLDGSMAARAMQWPRKGSLNLCGVPARLGGDGFANPLSNLPSREAQHEDPLASPEPTDPRDCPTPQVARSALKEALATPPSKNEAALAKRAAACGEAANSRLSDIVLQFLRQQHKEACLSAEQPVSTLPPLSLSSPNLLPKAHHPTAASKSLTRRLLDSQLTLHGGTNGEQAARQFVYSRFRQAQRLYDDWMDPLYKFMYKRHQRSVREAPQPKSCAYMEGGNKLLIGTNYGTLQVHDACNAYELLEEHAAHVHEVYPSKPIHRLQVNELGAKPLLLSTVKDDVKLWDASRFHQELFLFEDCRRACFDPFGRLVAYTDARLGFANTFDIATSQDVLSFEGEGSPGKSAWDLSYNRSGELLLWGPCLWDPRAPRMVRKFDMFGETWGSSTFHPAGLEAILNTEVWDLRTFRLRRTVPCLYNTQLAFNPAGTVAYATQRSFTDDAGLKLQMYRDLNLRSPQFSGFRTVDVTNYTEIASQSLEDRRVLDLAVDSQDNSLAIITKERESFGQQAKIYDIGRIRYPEDESDCEAGEELEEEESDVSEEEQEEDGAGDAATLASDEEAEPSVDEDIAASDSGTAEVSEEDSEAGSSEGSEGSSVMDDPESANEADQAEEQNYGMNDSSNDEEGSNDGDHSWESADDMSDISN